MGTRLSGVALLSFLAGGTLLASEAQAQECVPPRMMVILDKSSSMITGSIGNTPKWDIAVDALGEVTQEFDDQLEFGLTTFPGVNPDPQDTRGRCTPGQSNVDPALNTRQAIMDELSDPPPAGGNYTPMSQTMEAVATMPTMATGDMPRYAVLITDGWQWCDPYLSETRDDPYTEGIAALNAQGITTYVVGFGDAVDTFTLNQAAVVAGTAITGCDSSGDEPSDPNPCYYQADDPQELLAALTDIADAVTGTEVCDGEDNDCDGEVDENLTRDCASDCGSGTETCSNGNWVGCDAPEPQTEICDGEDNDCDGTIDPGCECEEGQTLPCGTADACERGNQTCGSDGTWGACEGAVEPTEEMCDGLDNDCDGETDETHDDVGGLCGVGQECRGGSCEDLGPVTPPGEDTGVPAADGSAAGCGCQTGTTGSTGFSLLVILGMVGLLRRRRK